MSHSSITCSYNSSLNRDKTQTRYQLTTQFNNTTDSEFFTETSDYFYIIVCVSYKCSNSVTH